MNEFILGVYIGGVVSCMMLLHTAFLVGTETEVSVWWRVGIFLTVPLVWFAFFGYVLYEVRRRRLEEERCANLLKKFYSQMPTELQVTGMETFKSPYGGITVADLERKTNDG